MGQDFPLKVCLYIFFQGHIFKITQVGIRYWVAFAVFFNIAFLIPFRPLNGYPPIAEIIIVKNLTIWAFLELAIDFSNALMASS